MEYALKHKVQKERVVLLVTSRIWTGEVIIATIIVCILLYFVFSNPDVILEQVIGENNGKGDVALNNLSKLKAVRNLFNKADLEPSIVEYEDSDETDGEGGFMVTLNNTVIENNAPKGNQWNEGCDIQFAVNECGSESEDADKSDMEIN